jgi:thioredoxin
MALSEVTEKEFVAEVMQSDLPVLVEFGADWCGPCKVMLPELVALQRELEGKAKVVRVDVDRSATIAREIGIQGVPTFIVFKDGRPVAAKSGTLKKAQLLQLLDPFLPRAAGAIKPEEAAALIAQHRITLVDTRDQVVWERVRLPGAANIPLAEIPTRLAELHMLAATPVLYCRSGELTKDVARRLGEEGTPVGFLDGGILGWEAAGLPVEKP